MEPSISACRSSENGPVLTPIRLAAVGRQKGLALTSANAVQQGLRTLALTVLGWLGLGGLALEYGGLERLFSGLGVVALPALLAVLALIGMPFLGLYQLVRGLTTRSILVACPFCGTRHGILSSTPSYVCSACAHVLMLGSGDKGELFNVQCPQCDTQWAAPVNVEHLACYSCGLPLVVAGRAVSAERTSVGCGACGVTVVRGVYYCRHCGELLSTPPDAQEQTSDWIWGGGKPPKPDRDGMTVITLQANSGIGWLVRAAWMAEGIRARLSQTNGILGSQEKVNLRNGFGYAVRSLDEALSLDAGLAVAVQVLLARLDQMQGRYLQQSVDAASGLWLLAYCESPSTLVTAWDRVTRAHNELMDRVQAMPAREELALRRWPLGLWGEPRREYQAQGSSGTPVFQYLVTDVAAYQQAIAPLAELPFDTSRVRVPMHALPPHRP